MRLRLEQRKRIDRRLQQMLIAPRPDYLATADERILGGAHRADREPAAGDAGRRRGAGARQRVARLRGVLIWSLRDGVSPAADRRRTRTCASSNAHVDALKAQYDAFVRARQAATHSYVGYEAPIARLRERVDAALQRVDDRDGPPGPRDRDGRDPRARGAPRAAGGLPEPGALRVRRQLRPRRGRSRPAGAGR